MTSIPVVPLSRRQSPGCSRGARAVEAVAAPTRSRAIGGPIADGVPDDSAGAQEIGFAIPERYNASEILFENVTQGRGARLAVTGPAGSRTMPRCAPTRRAGAMRSCPSALRGAIGC
jgi:hypothetical protein